MVRLRSRTFQHHQHLIAWTLATLAVALLALAGCGAPASAASRPTTTSAANNIAATQTAAVANCHQVLIKQNSNEDFPYFEPSSCEISAGTTVTFTNQSDITLRFFFGVKQKFIANPDGPSALNAPSGVTISTDESATFAFAKAGTFTITGTAALSQPNLDMTVTVTGG